MIKPKGWVFFSPAVTDYGVGSIKLFRITSMLQQFSRKTLCSPMFIQHSTIFIFIAFNATEKMGGRVFFPPFSVAIVHV